MAHKTLVNGTSYEVKGGRTLVDGTGYDIKGGRTLVDGVGYDVSFSIAPALNDCTWAEIRAASDAGLASSLWKVGDCKEIILNGRVGNYTFNNYTTYAYIIGFDHNAELEGSNRIHFQIGKTAEGIDIALCDAQYFKTVTTGGYFSYNINNANAGGWKSSNMRTNICSAMKYVLPNDLQTVIKSVTKYTDNVGNENTSESSVTATTDDIFILAQYEVFGSSALAHPYEANKQAQYAYYSAGNSVIKYNHSAPSTSVHWWLRSPCKANDYGVCMVWSAGQSGQNGARYSVGFAPCFCV